jgi:hypothetical protein
LSCCAVFQFLVFWCSLIPANGIITNAWLRLFKQRWSKMCVCVNHLNRCKTSLRYLSGFVMVHDFLFHAGGDRVAAWLSPTKLHAVD